MGIIVCQEAVKILFQVLVLLSSFFGSKCTYGADTITINQPITDPETLVSSDGVFKLGFFSPANTTNRYVGIWFNKIPKMTVVWVANRDKPLNDSSGSMAISENGNLAIFNGHRELLWTSNITNLVTNSSSQLSNTGNLVLKDLSNGRTLWESFQHPSDSFLQMMKISIDSSTGEKVFPTSWRSPTDPSPGEFSMGLDYRSLPEVVVWNGGHPHWRSGPWDGQLLIGVEDMTSFYNDAIDVVDNKQGTVYITFTLSNDSGTTYLRLDSKGILEQRHWIEGVEDWQISWTAPATKCDAYGACGPNGVCYPLASPICSCLEGFRPKNEEEWRIGNFNGGCERKMPLQCERNGSNAAGKGKGDGFLKLTTMKVPDFLVWYPDSEDDCQSRCLGNCSCSAYAYHEGIGCILWNGSLIDLQKFSTDGSDLYIRLAYSELDKKNDMKAVIVVSVIFVSILVAILTYCSWMWMAKRRGRRTTNETLPLKIWFPFQDHSSDAFEENIDKAKFEELPLFNIQKLLTATNNFHEASKLGQGGFGPVYKGELEDGQKIAVKRLSRSSGQGREEFMNEVVVISKLQHRNLVKLLGCCLEREEKMLVYEYMLNKSLDTFLFDPQRQELSDWRRRANIIEGIGRGLLYLHRDSRLRIIHRDLKASNILLDEDFEPKISDFGMARIFGGDEDQAKTRRVVGTYGYMAPEYAMAGMFSEKSDVFSFGVLMLEIISGRRNTSFYQDEQSSSLLGFAWNLWVTDRITTLIDPRLDREGFQMKILRCVHVGLLCVQEFAKDRPTISTSLSMLSSEVANLPEPKQPAFADGQILSREESANKDQEKFSSNKVTITMIQGR